MWVVTKDGFYSVVANRDDDSNLLVRCRVKAHAEALRDLVAPEAKIVDMPSADYRFRIVLSREDWRWYLLTAANDIDYDSHFKEAVRDAQPKKHREAMYTAMLKTWTAFSLLQPTPPYSKGKTR